MLTVFQIAIQIPATFKSLRTPWCTEALKACLVFTFQAFGNRNVILYKIFSIPLVLAQDSDGNNKHTHGGVLHTLPFTLLVHCLIQISLLLANPSSQTYTLLINSLWFLQYH